MLRSTHTVFAPVAGRRLVAHVSVYRRLGSVSVVATGPLGATQAVGRRWYSSYSSSSSQGGSQQSAPPGAAYQQQPTPAGAPLYPMPPPPYAMPQFVYAMPPPHMQSAGMSAPPLPDIGSPDRPMYVKSVAPPRGFQHYLMLFFFSFIAASALLNIVEQLEARNAPPMRPGGGGGAGSNRLAQSLFGSSDVAPVDLDSTNVTFADIQGCDEAKEELKEIVMFLKDPKKFHEMGAKLPKGALLVGPPGTGKTMLAKAIAKESGVKFFYANGSEFDEMFVGVGSRRVRELFAAAKANGPALIFIDEIDSLAGKRSSKDMSYSRMTLNQLLAEMDGFKSNEEIVVIAATNTPDVLDKALTRPGRFDTTIAVDPPDMKGRAAIAETYLKKIKRDIGVTADKIARATTGFTGAELANLINVAAIRAVVLGKGTVGEEEIEYAKDRVMMGSENRSKKIPEEERRITAYHEGGHALVALLLEKDGADPVHKATIIPRGSGIMGLVQQQAAEDKYSNSRRGMLSRLKVCLAGRVAEELILGSEDVTTGASSDFQQATRLARAMVRRFGFNDDLGTVDYESAESAEGAYISDATKQRIESEVQKLVTTAYKDAVKMLNENRPALDAIAQNLLAHETLSGEQLKAIVAGKPLPQRFSAAPASASAGTPPPPPPSGGLAVTIGKKAPATTTPPAKTPAAGQA